MNSEFFYVLTHKNKYEKEEKQQRQIEIDNLREDGLFRVALNNKLGIIKNLFEDITINAIELTVDENSMIQFGKSFGYEEMQAYNIRQKPGASNIFIVTRKEVELY